MDARRQRSREKLARAVLELAEREGIESVSMVAIALAAGVNRSTVYEHADSPIDLLRTVLRDELDDIRSRHLTLDPRDGVDQVAEAVVRTTIDVLNHVDAHAAIYARALGSGDSTALHGMLSGHIRQSALHLFRSGVIARPELPGLDRGLQEEAAARFIADGTVGAIDAWLQTPAPRDAEAFLTLHRSMLPEWWPR